MYEDKQFICNEFAKTLKHTTAFKHLKRLEYQKLHTGDEVVVPIYQNDDAFIWCGDAINVTADSGIAVIYDVMKALWKLV